MKGQITAKGMRYLGYVFLVILLIVPMIAYGNNVSKGITLMQHYHSRNSAYVINLVSNYPGIIGLGYYLGDDLQISVSDKVTVSGGKTSLNYYFASPIDIIPISKHNGSFTIQKNEDLKFNSELPNDCDYWKSKEVISPKVVRVKVDAEHTEEELEVYLNRLSDAYPLKEFVEETEKEVFNIIFTNDNEVKYSLPTALSKKLGCLLGTPKAANIGEIYDSSNGIAVNWNRREEIIQALGEI